MHESGGAYSRVAAGAQRDRVEIIGLIKGADIAAGVAEAALRRRQSLNSVRAI